MLLFSITLVGLVGACSTLPGAPTPTPEISDPGPEECQDAVLVVVWGDQNGDGIQDPDEPPLADVMLKIAPDDDPVNEGVQLTTSADGRAYFPTRELENCRPEGHRVLFLRQVAGYEFPKEPAVKLDTFVPDRDIVRFGLLPLSE